MKSKKALIIFLIFIAGLASLSFLESNFYLSLGVSITTLVLLLYFNKEELFSNFKDFNKDLLKNLGTCFLYAAIISIAFSISNNLVPNDLVNHNAQSLNNNFNANFFVALIMSCFSAPFIEEILFRILPFKFIKNKYLYLFSTAFLFGLFHVVFTLTKVSELLFVIPYFMIGFILAYVYLKHQNMAYPIISHIFYNLLVSLMPLIALLFS